MVERKPLQGRAREIAGVVLFALAVFLFLAVISYTSADPSLSNYETSTSKISNIGGIIGSYLADILIRFLGLSAYWLPLFLLITSVKLFLDAEFLFRPGWIGGFIGLVVTTSGLFAHAYKLIPLVDTPFAAGGFVGTLLSEYLNALFNPGGTFIFLFVGLIVSLIVTVDLSVVTALRKSAAVARSTGRGIRSYAELGREKMTDYLKEEQIEEREEPKKVEKRPPPVIREEKAPAPERTRKKKVEQTTFEFAQPKGAYMLPPLTLLDDVPRCPGFDTRWEDIQFSHVAVECIHVFLHHFHWFNLFEPGFLRDFIFSCFFHFIFQMANIGNVANIPYFVT